MIGMKRVLPEELERGINYKVNIELSNHSEHDLFYTIVDGLPASFERPFPVSGTCKMHAATTITYETSASKRGKYVIKKLYVRYTSTLGLWQKQMTIDDMHTVRVIPDLSETKHYLQDMQRYLLHEGTVIRKFQSGAGEFAQIRNYVVGDDPRMINWRQTAKLREVMTNEYEPEHGKYMTLLLDCGRMMGAELEEVNRLEKTLEAVITVAAAALEKGDYVSVIAFSKEVQVFVPAGKGMAHLQTILQAVYNVKAEPVEANYAHALSYVELHQKKRSLLLLFSDIRTFLYEESALHYLQRIRQRHVFFMIGIEDSVIKDTIRKFPFGEREAMHKSIAQQQMLFKKREMAKWEKQGLLMIEAKKENLAATAISIYFDFVNRNVI